MTKHPSKAIAKFTIPHSYTLKGKGFEEDKAAAQKREYEEDPGRPAGMRIPAGPTPTNEYMRGESVLSDMRLSPYSDPDSDRSKHIQYNHYYTQMNVLHKTMKGDTVEENKKLLARMNELFREYIKAAKSKSADSAAPAAPVAPAAAAKAPAVDSGYDNAYDDALKVKGDLASHKWRRSSDAALQKKWETAKNVIFGYADKIDPKKSAEENNKLAEKARAAMGRLNAMS